MGETCNEPAEKMSEKRIIPGGYFCQEKFDELTMNNSDILRALDSITGTNTSKEEIFRLVATIYDKVHKANKTLVELKLIYK